jgi:large subunit ribosomal protein L10
MRRGGGPKRRRQSVIRAQKEDKVATLHASFQEANLVVVAHQTGLTVAESTDLRRRMREVGASFRVTKNRLARIALKGTAFEHLDGMFIGPTGVAFTQDPVALAKMLTEYVKKNKKLAILGGGLDGQALDVKAIESLATLPPIEELRAKILGVLTTPASRLVGVLPQPASQMVGVLGAPAGNVIGVLKAYSQTEQAA